jgi:serine/threonine protein kinase
MLAPSDDLPVTLHVETMPPPASVDTAVQQLIDEMNQAWRRGERPHAADYVRGCAPLALQRDAVLRLVTEELCLRREAGIAVDEAALIAEFPEWAGDIRALLACRQLIEDEQPAAPALGKLRDFQLLAELGQGGIGRVYLATQPQLADRPVVVKVTPCRGQEHLSLARLQHTNIVPLYWMHDHPEDDERILCMPYFGSVTLGSLIAGLKDVPLIQRSGQHIVDVLDRGQSAVLPPANTRNPVRLWLGRNNYATAIAWMGSCLADALAYAHARDLLHLDIKPSNILWTTEGQPMLLDFHLARAPMNPGDPKPRGLGGTPLFMAPEQETALNAVCQNQPIPSPVDARADIYALGLVMYQALGGPVPYHEAHPPRLCSINPQVSTGLSDLIRKCLARNPEHRYASAEALAADLRRHISDLSLRGVPNRSLTERWGKWRRREPNGLAALTLALVMGIAAAAGGLFLWNERQAQARQERTQRAEERVRIERAERGVAQAQKHLAAEQYELAKAALEAAHTLLPDVPESGAVRQRLAHEQERLQHHQRLRQVHEVVNALRLGAVAQELTPLELAELTRAAHELVGHGERLQTANQRLDENLRQDLIDAVVIWSDLRQRSVSAAQAPPVRREILKVLADAEAAWGPSALLSQARLELLETLGEAEAAAALRSITDRAASRAPWERIAEARRLLLRVEAAAPAPFAALAGNLAASSTPVERFVTASLSPRRALLLVAAAQLKEAHARAPDSFWANYYEGIAAYRLGDTATALQAFRTAIAVAPAQAKAAAWHNWGLTHAQAGDWRAAIAAYSQALAHDNGLAAAALNRAVAHAEANDFEAALTDLDRAANRGAPRALVERNRKSIAARSKQRLSEP